MSDAREARHNTAVNPSRPPAEGGRDGGADTDAIDTDAGAEPNAAVNPSRPPAEGGRDDADR